MELVDASTYFHSTQFDAFDVATGGWNPAGIVGELDPVDRFITIYNRPSHLRSFGWNPKDSLPASYVLRNPHTAQVFVLGQPRLDNLGSEVYTGYCMAHLMTGHAGGLTGLKRKVTVGPEHDPGHLVESTVVTTWFDLELRSTDRQTDTDLAEAADYLLFAPWNTDIREWDTVTLRGEVYIVHQVAFDSGFLVCRATKTPDPRQDLAYHRAAAAPTYDPVTGVVAGSPAEYDVTGIVVYSSMKEAALYGLTSKDTVVIIKKDHIGFRPSVADRITVDGRVMDVVEVFHDRLGAEWRVTCKA